MSRFIDLKKIKIPVIQRDYVQGRGDEKSTEVRKNFLDDLFSALKEKRKFHLDFVYGSYIEDFFIPIDGQQRLTTLFLLYWYFSKKENKPILTHLTYETRVSARSFCERVEDFDIDFNKLNISTQIQNSKQFSPYWHYDPTIKSMLLVLDDIHIRSSDISLNDLDNITFEIFELKDFGEVQAEELYRKMNSRGKSLTPFENFKAIYEQISYNKSIDKYKEIARKFEKNWSNEFWEESENCNSIDSRFMNFIYFLTEMKSYEIGKSIEEIEKIKTFTYLKEFYQNDENFIFLEEKLDQLNEIKELSKYIEKNFTFFGSEFDLYNEITTNYDKVSIENKILFYLLVMSTKNNNLLDLFRIMRNELHRNRAFKNGTIKYVQTIDKKDIRSYLDNFLKLIDDEYTPYEKLLKLNILKHEKEKAYLIIDEKLKKEIFALEDHVYLRGDLQLFFDEKFNFKPLKERIVYLHQKIVEENIIDSDLFIRALLSIDNYSLWIGSVYNGSKYFFGQKGSFEVLFTKNSRSEENIEIYKMFFEELETTGMKEIIQNEIDRYKNQKKNSIYYFLKYPIITTKKKSLQNVFGWMEYENDYYREDYIEKLESEKRITLWHINVYILALLAEIKKDIDFNKVKFLDNGNSVYPYKNRELKVLDRKLYVGKTEFELFDKYDAIEEAAKIL